LLGMTIWYNILFTVNSVSKNLQSKDMCIKMTIKQLKGLLSFFESIEKVDLKLIFVRNYF